MNPKRILFLVMIIIPCLFCSLSMGQKEPIDYIWGESQSDVQLGSRSFTSTQILGQPVLIQYQLKNSSRNTIRCYIQPSVVLRSTTVWAGGYIGIVTQDNKPLVCRRPVPFPDKGVDIAPGKTYENKINLSQYFDFPGPGVYKASLTLRVHPSKDPSGNTGFDASSGEFQIVLEEDKTQKPAKSFDGDLELDKEIPVNLEWGTKDDPRMLVVQSVRFEVKKFYAGSFEVVQPHALLKMELISFPKTTWEIAIALIDETGIEMGYGQTSFSNSGIIISDRLWSPREDDITLTLKGEIIRAKKFRISVKQTSEKPSEENINVSFPQEKIPDKTVMVGYVDDSAEGKRSLAASGHAVSFLRPEKEHYIEAVQIFASRYGLPQAPEEDFHLYILNEKKEVLADIPYPYGMIERTDMMWYNLRTPSIEVPEQFFIALAFNPHQTKGIYLGYDENVDKTHSFTGLPEDGYEEVKEKYDWMVRVYLAEEPTKEKGVKCLADWKPPVRVNPFEGCLEAKYDAGESEHMQSYGGRGPAVKISLKDLGAPGRDLVLKGFRLYSSRYGSGYDTEKTFLYGSVLDSEQKLIQEFSFPYSLFSYKVKWVDLALDRKIVIKGGTESITIAFDPEAHQYKGIYFRYNQDPEKSHSFCGKVGKGFNEIPEREWIIRAYFEPVEQKEEQDVYMIHFKSKAPFAPVCARDLLTAFNESLSPDINTHDFRFDKAGGELTGMILVDGKAGLDGVLNMIKKNAKLEILEWKKGETDLLAKLKDMDLSGYAERPEGKTGSAESKGRNWGPEQATGEPDTPGYGDVPTAWASLTADGQDEWLVLEYENAVIPARIEIHETYNPGAVHRVTIFDEDGEEIEVWKILSLAGGSVRNVLNIPVEKNIKTKKIKIYLDSKLIPGWNEIDAVGLVDTEGKTQWGKKAEASSTYAEPQRGIPSSGATQGRAWGPEQATGEPDTPGYGDIITAWASLTPDDQDEWLLLEYENAVIPTIIEIHETYNPGAVCRVTLFDQVGKELEIWKAEKIVPGSERNVLKIPVKGNIQTLKVKIYLDSKKVPGWNEIDAVGLVGTEGKTQWAKKAEASSTYASGANDGGFISRGIKQ